MSIIKYAGTLSFDFRTANLSGVFKSALWSGFLSRNGEFKGHGVSWLEGCKSLFRSARRVSGLEGYKSSFRGRRELRGGFFCFSQIRQPHTRDQRPKKSSRAQS